MTDSSKNAILQTRTHFQRLRRTPRCKQGVESSFLIMEKAFATTGRSRYLFD